MFKSAQFILIAILGLVIIGYGTLFFMVRSIDINTKQIDENYTKEKEALVGTGNANGEVFDLQKRIALSKKLIENKNTEAIITSEFEKDMVDGVVLHSLDYEMNDKSVALTGNADNLYILAKQIAVLNNSEVFGGIVDGIKTTTGKDSGIDFSLKLKINNL